MKRIIFILVMGIFFQSSSARQVLATVIKTRTAQNNSGDYLHLIANDFVKEVGDQLKYNYPARVDNISVTLTWGQTSGYTLSYSADIVRDKDNYQWIFDHRGALSYGSYDDAKQDAQKRCHEQFMQARSKFKIRTGYMTVYSGYTASAPVNGSCMFLCEEFVATK
jgi:hypothetical protein